MNQSDDDFNARVRFELHVNGCKYRDTCLDRLRDAKSQWHLRDAVSETWKRAARIVARDPPDDEGIMEFLEDRPTEERFAGSVLLPMIVDAEKEAALSKKQYDVLHYIADVNGWLKEGDDE